MSNVPATTENKPSKVSLDPAVQAIFDAMDAFMGSTYVQCNASEFKSPTSTTYSITFTDKKGNQQTYTNLQMGNKVTVTPSSANLGAEATQQFTASVTDPDGVAVPGATFSWVVSPQSLGSVGATGLYTAPETVTITSTDQITCTVVGELTSVTIPIMLHP